MAIPSLPVQGSQDWFAYAQGLDTEARTIASKQSTAEAAAASGRIVSVDAYGAVGDGVADDTAAINAAIAALSSTTGGVLIFSGGRTYKTAGGHNFPVGTVVQVRGATINHTGDNVCFNFNRTGTFNLSRPTGIFGLRLAGNSGANAVGVEVGNCWGWHIDGNISGYSAGRGLLLNNVTNWAEGVDIDRLKVDGCAVAVQFRRTTGTSSFAYTRIRHFSANVPANGIGIDLGGDSASAVYLYNSDIDASIWLNGNNAIAFRVGPTVTTDNVRLNVVGELPGGITLTGHSGLKMDGGSLKAYGHVNIKDASNDTALGSVRITPGMRSVDTMTGVAASETFRALLVPNQDVSHEAMFGYFTGTNTSSPFVSAYDQGTDSFRIYKVPFGGNLATATLVCRVDKNGALFPGGGSTGVYSGAGSPEGAVSAAVGSVYLRNNGGPYTSLYLKTTTGTSGWHAVRSRDDIRISGEGLAGETYPRQAAIGTMATTSGVLFGTLIGTAPQDRLTNVHCLVATAGLGLTLVRLGYYARTGQLLASTGDVSASFTSTGAKTFAFTSSYLTPAPGGGGYLGILQVGTTPATLRSGAVMASSEMAAFGSGVPSSASLGSGLTDLPSPASAVNAAGSSPWFGWS